MYVILTSNPRAGKDLLSDDIGRSSDFLQLSSPSRAVYRDCDSGLYIDDAITEVTAAGLSRIST